MPSGLSTPIKDQLAGGASRLAALLGAQIFPIFSRLAPCHPGAALRDLVLAQRGQATRGIGSSKNAHAGESAGETIASFTRLTLRQAQGERFTIADRSW